MQNQESLAKLTQARQAQTLALQRFAQAQARLAQLEARQQALRTRLDQPSSEQEANSPNGAFLPTSGELELHKHFTPTPQTDQEKTEQIVTRPTEASQ